MSNYRVIFKRVVSADGRAIAEARSQVVTSNKSDSTVTQSVTVQVSVSDGCSHASSSSRVVSR
jgi:riboflavin biosynthesis pyrimidine reductase